jgi:hypothetical protein
VVLGRPATPAQSEKRGHPRLSGAEEHWTVAYTFRQGDQASRLRKPSGAAPIALQNQSRQTRVLLDLGAVILVKRSV